MKKYVVFASFFLLASCAKVTIKDTTKCVIAGVWRAGMDCATTLSSQTSEMDFEQMIEFLESQPERPDPDHPGKKLPARAGAFCESSDDQLAEKIALEQACDLLKNACSPEIKAAIKTAAANIQGLAAKSIKKSQPEAIAPLLQPFTLPVPPDPEPEEQEDPSRDDAPLQANFI